MYAILSYSQEPVSLAWHEDSQQLALVCALPLALRPMPEVTIYGRVELERIVLPRCLLAVTVFATCQSRGSHALKNALLYCPFN